MIKKFMLRLTFAVPRSVTTHTSIAVFPLITVTFVGVVGSMYGANVVVVVVDVGELDDFKR